MFATTTITSARRRLGVRVRSSREKRGLTQQSLADVIGIDRTYLSGIENGRRNVSFENLVRLARGLDIPLSELVDGVDVECDGKSYHSTPQAYAADMNRQKQIEQFGFVFYRIWSTNWFEDKSGEIAKFQRFIDGLK